MVSDTLNHCLATMPGIFAFNPDFAVEIVARVSNAKQISISGYFLGDKMVNYFEVKKCSEKLSCKVFGSCSRFSIAKSGCKLFFNT